MIKFIITLLLILPIGVLSQTNFPNKPIRIIIAYPPGGGNDVLARILAPKLSENMGQQVVVENRPGGNTIIGTEALAKSPRDGHTLILITGTHVINPFLLQLPYDPIKDFAPVATLATTELVLVLHPSVKANNLQELIALAKSESKLISYASSGNGSILNVAGEIFNTRVGVKIQHIPYKGSGQLLTDLVGGQIQMSFQPPNAIAQQVKAGTLKAIAISGDNRSSILPLVPTFAEVGLPNLDIKAWYGVLAPVGTSAIIINKLANEFKRVLEVPEIKANLEGRGFPIFWTTPEQFGKILAFDLERYGRIVKDNNIKLE
ncbi:MAG: tripartite tricarboxylate transporter substrate binding protein [Betaproteobacteria bacterium]